VCGHFGLGSPTPSPSQQQREQGPADHVADRQSLRRGVGPHALNQAVRKLDGKRQLGFARCDRAFQPLRQPQVTIGLTKRYGAVPRQLAGSVGKLIRFLEQFARMIEPLRFFVFAGPGYMS
jgi:hypothetical protein